MTPERQMIVIAETQRWMRHPVISSVWRTPEQCEKNIKLLGHIDGPWNIESNGPPDYLNDLNAMHEAEKVLTRNQRHDYMDALEIVAGDLAIDEWDVVTSTAAQRAEAFLKALNKWEES